MRLFSWARGLTQASSSSGESTRPDSDSAAQPGCPPGGSAADHPASHPSLAQVAAYCAALRLPYQLHEEDNLLLLPLPGRHGTYLASVRLIEERCVVLLRAASLLTVPPERRGVVGQAACHINTLILLGAFALDLADGTLGFDLPLVYEDVGISQAEVERCLAVTLWTLDNHLPVLQRLCWTDQTAEEALGLPLTFPWRELLDGPPAPDDSRNPPA